MSRPIRFLDDIPRNEITRKQIRIASVMRLPFRLCTGRLQRFDHSHLQVWLRNKLPLPTDSHYNPRERTHKADFCTDALLVNSAAGFSNTIVECLRASQAVFKVGKVDDSLLRDIITATQIIRLGPVFPAGNARIPSLSRIEEVFSLLEEDYILIMNPDTEVPPHLVEELLDIPLNEGTNFYIEHRIGSAADFTEEEMCRLRESLDVIRMHPF